MNRIFCLLACGLVVACATDNAAPTSASAANGADAATTADAAKPADASAAATPDGTAASAGGPTYHKDIAPILATHCAQCHSGGGIAPFALDNYGAAKATLASGLAAIDGQRMPPWSARDTATCKPQFGWRHDPRLTAAERKLLSDWQAAGTPEGNAADAVKAAVPQLNLANTDATYAPKAPYVAAGAEDQLRCFVLDAEFAETKYLNGVQLLPGNPLVVHHVLLFVDPDNSSAKLADKDGQYTCFGSAQLNEKGNLIAAWAPGGLPIEYPEGAGAVIPKGSKIVMQVHYHPAGKTAAPDVSKVQMRFVKGAPTMLGDTVLIGNAPSGKDGEGLLPGPNDSNGKPEFVIPAGAVDHTEEMAFTIPATINGKPTPQFKIYAVGTHMHYVGRKMDIRVERVPPKAPCTQTMLAGLSDCTAQNCAGKTGLDLATCAQNLCKTAVAGIDAVCGECLKNETLKGSPSPDIMKACTTAPPAASIGPDKECLVETPAWDFNWQRIYVYDAPLDKLPVITGGDRLRMKCTYDNSMANPFVVDALKAQGKTAPQTVKLGESTLDEMCLAVVQILFKPTP